MTAVVIGVWSMIFLSAIMRGVTDRLVENGISTLTGHIQVHAKGYLSDPVIEHSMENPLEIKEFLEKVLPHGSNSASRVRVNAVANNARNSGSVTLVGIDPDDEGRVSFIQGAISEGRYLHGDDKNGIVVGKALLDNFDTKLGRKLVLMSQDRDKDIASKAFRIVGVYRAEMESTEKNFVFILKSSAQKMLKMGKSVSEVSAVIPEYEESDEVASLLEHESAGKGYEVTTWREALPLTVAILKMYDWFIYLWFIVVFIAMAFGIVNTTLMAVFERIREFGLMKALGMKPLSIIKEVLTESGFMLVVGMALGNLAGFLSVYSLKKAGIDLTALSAGLEFIGLPRIIYPTVVRGDVVSANLVVFVLGLLVSLYPAYKAGRISPVEAMAHI